MTRRLSVLVLLASAGLQGLSVVVLPASATVLYDRLGLTDADYGALFVPQTVGALVGALIGDPLCRARGTRLVLALSTGLHLVAQLLLATATPGLALPMLQLAAACLGLGFGLSAVPLNSAAPRLLPRRAEAAIVAVHTAVGLGFAAGPLAIGMLAEARAWLAYPLALLGFAALLLVATSRACMRDAAPVITRARTSLWKLAPLAGVAIAYAFAEGTFANWATTFLREDRGVSAADAGLALSAFWAALALGRLLVTALLTRVRPILVWAALPVAMAGCLLALPAIEGALSGVLAYAAAGVAASAFFPLTVAIATERARVRPEAISAVLTASLMVGVGVASAAIGALRESLGLDLLFRVSAIEPLVALALGLIAFSRRRAAPGDDS